MENNGNRGISKSIDIRDNETSLDLKIIQILKILHWFVLIL